MSRQKLSFLIGFPLFGILIMHLPELLGSSSIPDILFYVNVVPVTMGFIFGFIMKDLPTNIHNHIHDFEIVFYLSFNIIFWLPIGFLVNLCLEKYKLFKTK